MVRLNFRRLGLIVGLVTLFSTFFTGITPPHVLAAGFVVLVHLVLLMTAFTLPDEIRFYNLSRSSYIGTVIVWMFLTFFFLAVTTAEPINTDTLKQGVSNEQTRNVQ